MDLDGGIVLALILLAVVEAANIALEILSRLRRARELIVKVCLEHLCNFSKALKVVFSLYISPLLVQTTYFGEKWSVFVNDSRKPKNIKGFSASCCRNLAAMGRVEPVLGVLRPRIPMENSRMHSSWRQQTLPWRSSGG